MCPVRKKMKPGSLQILMETSPRIWSVTSLPPTLGLNAGVGFEKQMFGDAGQATLAVNPM